MSLFITFEGGEGSGKTTIASLLHKQLLEEGYNITFSREPGGVDIAEQIRDVITDVKNTHMDARTEALLYAASRRQHLVEKVLPVLNDDGIVICDRFIDSSLVYQGIGRGIGVDNIYNMNLFATDGILPDVTIFFDVKPEVALKRITGDREINRLDLESLEFHQKVYEGYLQICKKYPNRIVKIDASLPVEDVYNQVYTIVKDRL